MNTPARFFLCLCLSLCFSAALHAQLPADNDAWKSRCNALSTSGAAALKTVPNVALTGALTAETKGVPAQDFFVLAVDRAQAGDHYVACTMYFLAAIAERSGNGATPDPETAQSYAIVAGSELKLARHKHLGMEEHVKRVKLKVEEMAGKPLSLTADQTTAALTAASTVPF